VKVLIFVKNFFSFSFIDNLCLSLDEVKRSEAEMNQSAQFFHFVQDENSEMIGKVISLQFYL
jgi:hypothetical protein